MIGINIDKGWNFATYDNGSPINSRQQIHICHKKGFEIHMLQHSAYEYTIKHSITTSKNYNSYVDKMTNYEDAKGLIKNLMVELIS